MTTVTTNSAGIVLNAPSDTSPVVVAPGVTIAGPGHGIYARNDIWTIQSAGTISAAGYGINLHTGGSVTNTLAGVIAGGGRGVLIAGSNASVANYGAISASSPSGYGAFLSGGGSIYNGPSASITGGLRGVIAQGASVAITNFGTIAASAAAGIGAGLPNGGDITNALGAKITGSVDGILAGIGIATVTNFGEISGTGVNGGGISLTSGGLVINMSPGTISALGIGIASQNNRGSVVNSGAISANGLSGIFLLLGGDVTNNAPGVINAGTSGIGVYGLPGTIRNQGNIAGGGFGVQVHAGGVVTNDASGVIVGGLAGINFNTFAGIQDGVITNYGTIIGVGASGVGVTMSQGGLGTLVNAGLIIGASGTAVRLNGTNGNLLVLKPGAAFSGIVEAGLTMSNTLELAPGAGVGTLSGLGTSFVNFGSIVLDPGAQWRIAGNAAAFSGTITGFDADDTLALTGITATQAVFASGTLFLSSGVGGGAPVEIKVAGNFGANDFQVAAVPGGVDVRLSAACFASGTCIATPAGMVPVEQLAPGDRVMVVGGGVAPIVWIGHRHVALRQHPRRHDVMPVRVSAHAFGYGKPRRDVVLSPDHAVHLANGSSQGMLVPIRYLLNGRTIAQEEASQITYYHIELPSHGVVLAEGLPCESYLDTGNRAAFANGGTAVALHPDFAREVWSREAFAELVLSGRHLVVARRMLLAQAHRLGHELTDKPRLVPCADDRRLVPTVDGAKWTVPLPSTAHIVRLHSRHWRPADSLADSDDARVLGVAVTDLRLDGRRVNDTQLVFGWHPAERPGTAIGGASWRWTDGDAGIRVGKARVFSFRLVMTGKYWISQQRMNVAGAWNARHATRGLPRFS